MVFKRKISAEQKAFVKFLRQEGDVPVKEIVHRCGISRATIYRWLKSTNQSIQNSKKRGRPRLISEREERTIRRTITRLRKQEGNFSCQKIRAGSGLHHVSLWTVNRTLKRMGYAFLEARRKGILLEKDFKERVQFARKVKRNYSEDFFKKDIYFYLDGVSFYHKTNPMDDARAPQGKVWRKRKEGLSVTAKGSHVGSGGRVVKMIVAISFGKGVIYCEEYEKLDGTYFANFVRRNFGDMFRKSGKNGSKLFVQDNCPILNCAKARKAVKEVGGKLFAIPKRSGDLNPIENIFNVVKKDLKTQAICLNITSESYQQFAQRVETTLYSLRREIIDNTIASMYNRLDLIIRNRGRRTKY